MRGVCLAVLGALTVGIGQTFGLDLDQVALLGVALGGVIGLVPDRPLGWRIGGFLVGFAVAWAAYAARAGFLPDTPGGRAVATFGVLILLVAVALVTREKLPLWSMLVGSAAMVGAYEVTYTASSPTFMTDSPVAATSVLLASAIGVIGSVIVSGDESTDPHSTLEPRRDDADPVAMSDKETVS